MSERVLRPPSAKRRTFDLLLSNDVRPFLRARGFTKSRTAFRRSRGPLYDLISFQSNRWNGVTPWHGFFVNVGVGSNDMDAVSPRPGADPGAIQDYVLHNRWESLVSGLPAEMTFDATTDLRAFAQQLCDGLDRVLTVIDSIDTTQGLVQWSLSNNHLLKMEKTCRYLAATGDIDSLTQYITALRERFGAEPRWAIFNRRLTHATGGCASTLVQQGLLDPVEGSEESRQ